MLGPLLFLSFMNDLPAIITHSNRLIYAHDTAIITSHKSPYEVKKRLNFDLINFHRWCAINNLQIGLSKTTFMIMSSSQNLPRVRF